MYNKQLLLELDKYDTTDSFFEDFKKRFNKWVWIWFTAVLLAFSLLVADFVITLVFKDSFLKWFYFRPSSTAGTEIAQNGGQMLLNTFIYRVVTLVIYLLIFGYLAYSMIAYKIISNKEKSFVKQSGWTPILTFIVALYAVFNLIQYMYNSGLNQYANYAIALFAIELISSILYIFIYFVPAGQIRKLIKFNVFVIQNVEFKDFQKKYREVVKESDRGPLDILNLFNKMSADMAFTGDFPDDVTDEERELSRRYAEAKREAEKRAPFNPNTSLDEEKVQAMEKLMAMPNSQLFQMAAILNISGYQDMTKDELASLIYNYTKEAQVRWEETKKEIKEDQTDKK
ncbi:hypothetical protein [Mycoplasma sp. 005V]|uniref:hypothetical protein n=1 Tax=unclassified Mycoplasma TaxID=2683645 RepID=UPI003A836993